MSLDWFPWYIRDYRRDTQHLTLEEEGAYRRLIDEYMYSRKPLPNDDAALARILGIPKTDWDRLAPKVRRFFRARNDKLWHKRCEDELHAQDARHNRNSERGKKAAFARYSKFKDIPNRSMLAPATLHNTKKLSSLVVMPQPPPAEQPEAKQEVVRAKAPHEYRGAALAEAIQRRSQKL